MSLDNAKPVSRLIRLGLISGLALCILPGAALAAIVVASSGPSKTALPVGKKLSDNGQLVLKEGDTVTLLDQQGTRVLHGAGTFNLRRGTSTVQTSTFAALTRPRTVRRVRTGAVRDPGPGQTVKSPNLWYVDLATPGTKCVVDTANIRLWRAASATAASYMVSADASTSTRAAISFAVGETLAPWDNARLPVTSGASYSLVNPRGQAAGKISFSVMPSQPADPESMATALIERGCTAQLELLASTLAGPAQ